MADRWVRGGLLTSDKIPGMISNRSFDFLLYLPSQRGNFCCASVCCVYRVETWSLKNALYFFGFQRLVSLFQYNNFYFGNAAQKQRKATFTSEGS